MGALGNSYRTSRAIFPTTRSIMSDQITREKFEALQALAQQALAISEAAQESADDAIMRASMAQATATNALIEATK